MEKRFLEKVSEYAGKKDINMQMSFKEDLLFDSLRFTKMIVDLEESFNIEFDDDIYIVENDIKLIDIFKIVKEKVERDYNGTVWKF